MNSRNHALGATLFLTLALATSTAALAQHEGAAHPAAGEHGKVAHEGAEKGGHGGAAHHEPHLSDINWFGIEGHAESPALGYLTITFLIFAGGVIYLVRKPLSLHLQTRADTVEKAIAEATRAKEEAEKRARDAEARLAALDGEVKKMKADFESQGKAEAERIEKAAADMSARIAKDAEDTIGAETERAREVLRAEASKLALQLAEERIKSMLNAADDDRLKKSLISDLSA